MGRSTRRSADLDRILFQAYGRPVHKLVLASGLCVAVRVAHNRLAVFHGVRPLGTARYGDVVVHRGERVLAGQSCDRTGETGRIFEIRDRLAAFPS